MTQAEKALRIVAAQEGCSVAHIRGAIQAAIDDAWNTAWTPGNLQAQVAWQQLFPGGKKPTVEEFIAAMTRRIKENESHLQLH